MLDRSISPRPEYPRPDRQRSFVEGSDWLNLNGPWQFRFDGEDGGRAHRWFDPATGGWEEQIIVPFCWESLAAWGEGGTAGNNHYYAKRVFRDPLSVTRENHRSAPRYEVGWYRREIRVPRTGPWSGKQAILTVGAADFFTDGWCDGRPLGHHEGGYTPFEFDLTPALGEPDADGFSRAVIVLRVEDPMENAEQPVGKQWRWYTTTSGIWQTVFVEPRHASHLRPFRIVPDLDRGTAGFHLPCAGAQPGDTVEIEVHPPGHTAPVLAGNFPVDPAGGFAAAEIEVPGRVPWDHTDPRLYHVRLRLRRGGSGGAVLDEVRTYFGLRKISTAPAHGAGSPDDTAPAALCLNNQPVYLRGALHQSFYPEGVYTAGDASTLRNDIARAKEGGFDFLRIHIKIDDPLLLHYADTMGILLMLDFPNFGEGGDTPTGRRRYEETMRGAIERDFNHPAVIAWCTFNETWGFGGQVELVKLFGPQTPGGDGQTPGKLANRDALAWVQQTWELAKSLDPTRLIEDMSVVYWEHLDYYAHGDTDINSWHFYINDYARAKEHIEKVVNSTYAGSMFNYAEGYAQKRQPLITSEYGGIGALDGDVDISWSFKFLTNELRRQPKLSAYVFTQLHDVEWEYNGFLNYDRTRKEFGYDPRLINNGDVLPLDAPPIRRCRPGERVRVPISTSHYARRECGRVTLDWRLSGIDATGRITPELARGGGPIEYPARRVEAAGAAEFGLPPGGLASLCQLTVTARSDDGGTLAQNFVEFFVSPGYPPARRELPGGGFLLCVPPADWCDAAWSVRAASREEAGAADRSSGWGAGFFEWSIPLDGIDLRAMRRLRILAEASSCREGTPQTDEHAWPTALEISINGVPVSLSRLPNHPHDARGSLSYLRGGRGAYGYLTRAAVEGELLRRVVENGEATHLRLRCAVPADGVSPGGLVIYGPESGRYPFGLTLFVEPLEE